MMRPAWQNKITGEVERIFAVGESVEEVGYSIETHDLIEVGEDFETQVDENAVPPVPATVTPLQMRRAIRASGLTGDVASYLATADDEVVEAWEYATQIDRDNEFIALAATALEKTTDEIDDLFRLAATQ